MEELDMLLLRNCAATRVLRRFVRQYATTYYYRREAQSLRLLSRAFDKACARSIERKMNVTLYALTNFATISARVERRDLLQRRFSTPQRMRLGDDEVTEQSEGSEGNGGDEPAAVSASDDEPVTFEKVVQHLHAQIEAARQDCAERDRTIEKLDALVRRLTTENQRLYAQLDLLQALRGVNFSISQGPQFGFSKETAVGEGSNQLTRT